LIVAAYLLNQARKPTRWIGRLFVWLMNISHSGMTDWGLKHVSIEKRFTILDVGCGGGRTIQKLAAIATEGMIYGVDYAKGSVAASRGKNAQLIKDGRVAIRQASVSRLPFPDGKFDLVTAVETQYYWPDLVNDMREILRALKPGGKLIIIAESYRGGRYDSLKGPVMKLLRSTRLSVDEHQELFSTAGYTDVRVFEERDKGWICATGRKPL
jgi:SAM-dependent methyltransferase